MSVACQPLNIPWIAGRWFERSDGLFAILAVCCVMLGAGVLEGAPLLIGAGSAGLCLLGRMLEHTAFAPRRGKLVELASRLLDKCGRYNVSGSLPTEEADKPEKREEEANELPESIASTEDLVDAMLATRRYALLLRPESVRHLDKQQRERAVATLDEQMALVPAGSVLTGMAAERATLGEEADTPLAANASGVVAVDPCYLNRRPVTNSEYQQFVDAGGYEQLDLWPEEALPALFGFVDQTGEPGPRYWSEGQLVLGDERLPVVGVSWYEAVAYANWVGKRLPTDAEWTKACAWPIESAPGRIAQRRYPWGESFDAHRANLWVTGRRRLAAVDEFSQGVTVGGLDQMIGNVWEWSLTPLNDATTPLARLPTTLRCLRGGAFNTYFENQATCHYQSADHPLARRPNIGVRLALSMSSLSGPA